MANTSAPLSEVAIAAMAAGILDDFTLTSLDDNTPLARMMAREFGFVRDEISVVHPWTELKSRAVLAPVVTAPAFGWKYAYNVPSDCLRVLPLRAGGLLNGRPIPYEYESRQILTDEPTQLYIHYIRRETNIALWSPLLARAFAARLAILASTRVTGKMQYYTKATEAYRSAMYEAQHVDSLSLGTPESQNRFDIIDARVP